jgi:hypothetical protein
MNRSSEQNTDKEGQTPGGKVSFAFKNEYQRACDAQKDGKKLTAPENPKKLSLNEYQARCKYLRPGFLDGRDISEIFRSIDPEDFMLTFAPKSRHCLAVIPFDQYGYDLTEQQIKNHEYLILSSVRYDGLTGGITVPSAYYFSLLPEDIQKHCTFTIPEYSLPLSPDDKTKLIANIKDAITLSYTNLQLLMDTGNRAAA